MQELHTREFYAAGFALIATLIVGAIPASAAAEPTVYAGAASASVNPPSGSYIAGDARNRKFAGVHDDIFAKAVVVRSGDAALALVVVDCLGLVYPDIQRIRQQAAGRVSPLSLPAEHIVVVSTHTHCGPDVVGLWGPNERTSGKDAAYMERLIDTAATQVAIAAERLQPATMRSGATQANLDWVENICEPELLDSTLSVLQFVNADGAPIATLTNFACHPTVMDGVTDQVSSDYVAGYYRAMKAATPGEHLFLQGAIGGWVQPRKSGRSFALADRYGTSLAQEAISVLGSATPVESSAIQFERKTFSLPLENEGFKALASLGIIDRGQAGTIETEVAWFKIGSVQFATHPGETSPVLSLQTRALMGEGTNFVLGLALDALGYILKPEYFTNSAMKYAEYLTSMSVGPRTEPLVLEALKEIIP